jgi:ribosomal protein L35
MKKQKTSKTAVKRIKRISAAGKILKKKTLAQHLVHRKSRRTIKESGIDSQVSKAETSRVKRLTPYGVK